MHGFTRNSFSVCGLFVIGFLLLGLAVVSSIVKTRSIVERKRRFVTVTLYTMAEMLLFSMFLAGAFIYMTLSKSSDIKALLYRYLAFYIQFSVFALLFVAVASVLILIKTKRILNKVMRIVLRIALITTLSVIWIYYIFYKLLYPIALASYEYKNNNTENVTGRIESIEEINKETVHLVIDGDIYKMVWSSTDPPYDLFGEIDEGDSVKVTYGEKSKYIYCIEKLQSP